MVVQSLLWRVARRLLYPQIVDLSHSPSGRIFTMFIATAGILNFTYMMSVVTTFLVEADFNEALRRGRMQPASTDYPVTISSGALGACATT